MNRRTVVWTTFVVLSVLLGLFAIYRNRNGYSYYDELEYLRMAESIAAGDGLTLGGTPTAYKPPVWPVSLSALMIIGVPAALYVLVSVGSAVGAALLARGITEQLAGPVAGWVAAFGMLLYPLNVYTAATLYPQALATLLLLLPIRLMQREPGVPRRRTLATTGAALAALVLTVPTMVFSAAVIAAWAVWRFRRSWGRVVLIVGLAGVLPVAAWATRNHLELGTAVPLSTATGVNLLLGNSANATPTSGAGTDISASVHAADGMSEVERNVFFTGEARAWVEDDPGGAARLYVGKVANYFAPYNAPLSDDRGSTAAMLVGWATFIPLVLVAVARLGWSRWAPLRSPEVLMWVLFFGNAAFMAIAFTRTRFRQPLDSFLLMEAAVLAVIVVTAWRASSRCADDRRSRPATGRSPAVQGPDATSPATPGP